MNEAFDRKRRVVSGESGLGPYGQVVVSRRHVFTADEPTGLGGSDTGPDPVEILLSSLATCTAMTVRMYAQQRRLDVGKITVVVEHQWLKDEVGRTLDRIEKLIHIEPQPPDDVLHRLLDIADRCPVHRAMSGSAEIVTRYDP